MKSLTKHLNSAFIIILFSLNSCWNDDEAERNKKVAIAVIDDSVYTFKDFQNYFNDSVKSMKGKAELLKEMIDKEVLFKAAREDSLYESTEYSELVERAKKEIAIALFLNKQLRNINREIKENELRSYYDSKREEFRVEEDTYLVNYIDTEDPALAAEFQTAIINLGWDKAFQRFGNKVKWSIRNKLLTLEEVEPEYLKTMIENLTPGESSIATESGYNNYFVAQLVKKYTRDEVPEFEYLKDKIKHRVVLIKEKQFYNTALNDLYNKYKVEIIKDKK